MGLFYETEILHRNIIQNIEHLRKQVILLKIHSRQLNAIPMGFSRQKSCIENIEKQVTGKNRTSTESKQYKLLKI